MGNLFFYSQLGVFLFFSFGVGVLLTEGEMSMFYLGITFSSFIRWVASFVLHFKGTSVDGKGGFGVDTKVWY